MNSYIGQAAKILRKRACLTQTELANIIGITQVHLSNFENGKSPPSAKLLEKYLEQFKIDLHMMAWSLFGNVDNLPEAVRKSANNLKMAWRKEFEKYIVSDKG